MSAKIVYGNPILIYSRIRQVLRQPTSPVRTIPHNSWCYFVKFTSTNSSKWVLPSIGLEARSRIRPRFFDQVEHKAMYASSGNKHFFTKSCHLQTYQNYEQPPRISQNLIFKILYFLKLCLIFVGKLFIILVSLRMTRFSEKMHAWSHVQLDQKILEGL